MTAKISNAVRFYDDRLRMNRRAYRVASLRLIWLLIRQLLAP